MDVPQTKKDPFNALNGDEVRKIICKKIFEKLGEYGQFSMAVSYPKFMWKASIEIDAYPLPETIKVDMQQGQVLDQDSEENAGFVEDIEPEKVNVVLGTMAPIEIPDKERYENDLKIPKPTMTDVGIVDIPLEKEETKGKEIIPQPKAVKHPGRPPKYQKGK